MRNAIVIAVLCAVSGIAHAQRATVVVVDDSMSSEKLEIAARAIGCLRDFSTANNAIETAGRADRATAAR